jgi:hypothetical protein
MLKIGEEVKMANKYMKKCSSSLAFKGMQIKTTLTFHNSPVRVAIFKNKNNNKYWQGCSETGTLMHCWLVYK